MLSTTTLLRGHVEVRDRLQHLLLAADPDGGAELAFAVYEGVIREVYRITGWLPAGSTFNYRYGGQAPAKPRRRWEFVGVIAEDRVRKRYVNRLVGFAAGAQNPVSCVNPGKLSAGTGERVIDE